MMFFTPIFDSRACCAEQIVQTGRQCVFARRLDSTTSVFSSSFLWSSVRFFMNSETSSRISSSPS